MLLYTAVHIYIYKQVYKIYGTISTVYIYIYGISHIRHLYARQQHALLRVQAEVI